MSSSYKIASLARLKRPILHAKDLAILWGISEKNTLYTNLKRYTKKKLLFRLHKGLYSLFYPGNIDPYLIGIKSLHRYGYISTESVLSEAGVIMQKVFYITMVSDISRKFDVSNHSYVSRQMKDEFLFNHIGIEYVNGVRKATVERAIADLLYFNPKAVFDAQQFIDWDKVKAIQEYIGYPLTPKRYATTK